MKDILAHLETLRVNIAKCEELERSAKSDIKRSVFRRTAAHYRVLAGELERALAEMQAKDAAE
ncbi:hypothetical protein [Bradyrhizobium sp. Gha]|uniref:hypothetical protein n=1 Tax=Bradyrhizobium sp. Gha TaxID=1855318 RepID=UPI0008EC08D6|nr:hypothetical protein [Bradyrhizobium sp. Gha]SFJ52172.1 hypothetical protein SAMN05216525_12744 [Bradyrhizobium sp. Gha]